MNRNDEPPLIDRLHESAKPPEIALRDRVLLAMAICVQLSFASMCTGIGAAILGPFFSGIGLLVGLVSLSSRTVRSFRKVRWAVAGTFVVWLIWMGLLFGLMRQAGRW